MQDLMCLQDFQWLPTYTLTEISFGVFMDTIMTEEIITVFARYWAFINRLTDLA
jgi:hypothetical protein